MRRIATLMGLTALLAIGSYAANVPRLVGFGCVGSTGPLYADEEDHFPLCDRIERY